MCYNVFSLYEREKESLEIFKEKYLSNFKIMEVNELLKMLWIPEDQVKKEKRIEWTEVRYKDNMLDFRLFQIDVYQIIWDKEQLLFNLDYDRKDLIEVLKKILQLNTEIC